MISSPASPFLLSDRQLLTWVLYSVTLYVFVIKPNKMNSQDALWATYIPLILCFVLFGLVGIHFYYFNLLFLVCYMFVYAAIVTGAVIITNKYLLHKDRH